MPTPTSGNPASSPFSNDGGGPASQTSRMLRDLRGVRHHPLSTAGGASHDAMDTDVAQPAAASLTDFSAQSPDAAHANSMDDGGGGASGGHHTARPPLSGPRSGFRRLGLRGMKQRLLVVANRLPVSANRRGEDQWSLEISAGGLVSALLGNPHNSHNLLFQMQFPAAMHATESCTDSQIF
jgi:trehalose 6-phosphate synthase/phosphatase